MSLANTPSVDVIENIEGVEKVEELGGADFRVYFTEAQSVMNRLVEKSAVNHWCMTEIRLEKSSLDTIFAELSRKK